MSLPPISPLDAPGYFVRGKVIVHETAAIAPGVILDAGPDYEIQVGPGVCIGWGCVITAMDGDVILTEGVTLAPGVLILGPAHLGEAACVGSRTTLFGQDVDAQAVIPAGTLAYGVMDFEENSVDRPSPRRPIAPLPSPWDQDEITDEIPKDSIADVSPIPGDPPPIVVPDSEPSPLPTIVEDKPPVVGQVYISQLLMTLFPERRARSVPKTSR